jgi:predicted N-acyltransferase
MRVEVFRSLAAIPRATWNSLAGEAGLYASHEWLTAIEVTTSGYCRYLVAYDGNRAVAGLPVYFVTEEHNEYYDPRSVFRNAAPERTGFHCLAGSRSGYSNEPLLAAGLTEADQHAAVSSVLAALCELAGQEGNGHCYLLYLNERGRRRFLACTKGMRPVLSYSGDAWIEATGHCFDDYLTGRSQKRRTNIRREIRRFADHGLHVTRADARDHLDLIVDFASRANVKYGVDVAHEDQLLEFKKQCLALGDRSILFICKSGTTVLGAALAFAWHDWLYMRMSGFDQDLPSSAYKYFNVVIYEPLKYCYESGLRGIHLGTGSHQAKAERGAHISPLTSVALPAGGHPETDLASAASRAGARRYWDQQLAARPCLFDSDQWRPVLDLCQ